MTNTLPNGWCNVTLTMAAARHGAVEALSAFVEDVENRPVHQVRPFAFAEPMMNVLNATQVFRGMTVAEGFADVKNPEVRG